MLDALSEVAQSGRAPARGVQVLNVRGSNPAAFNLLLGLDAPGMQYASTCLKTESKMAYMEYMAALPSRQFYVSVYGQR